MPQRVIVVTFNECGRRIGQTHHNSTIPDEVVERIRRLHEDYGFGYKAIAAELNISRNTIAKICSYQRRAQTPARWKRIMIPVTPVILDKMSTKG